MITQDIEKFMSKVLPKLIEKAAMKTMQDGLTSYLENRGYTDKNIAEAVYKATCILENLQTNNGGHRKNNGELVKMSGGLEKSPPLPSFLVNNDIDRLEHYVNTAAAFDSMFFDPSSKYYIDIEDTKNGTAKPVEGINGTDLSSPGTSAGPGFEDKEYPD